jgi:hypothetical protein
MQNMSAAINSVLAGITNSGDTVFSDIKEYPTTEFLGTPAATIVPSDNISDYATINQNLRTYAFFVDMFIPIESSTGGYATSFSTMRQLLDLALDAFDNSNDLNMNNQYGSSAEAVCDFLRPVPSSWSMVESGSGDLLMARITLQCAKTVNTNNA